jgi:hypothetical protein
VVVAQLAERSLPTPEIRGSNPSIGKIYPIYLSTVSQFRKDENKRKRGRNGPFKKKKLERDNTVQ